MSFTSQNYAVGKHKRMDRVLIDCMVLSISVALILGGGAYLFGTYILNIYTSDADVIKCGYSTIPMILSIIGTVGIRILWIFVFFPMHRSLYFLFISYPGSWIATIVMQVICYMLVRKKIASQGTLSND